MKVKKKVILKKFIEYAPKSWYHKTFLGVNLLTFCNLDLLTTPRQIIFTLIKWSSLQKAVVNDALNILWESLQLLHSQHFMFFITPEWVQKARVLQNTWL